MRPSTTIFDQERDAADAALEAEADLTREFWGEGAGWVTGDRTDRAGRIDHSRRTSAFQIQTGDHDGEFRLDHTPTSIRAIRDGLAAFRPKRVWRDDSTGPVERTRAHGIVRPSAGAAADGQRRPRRPSPEALPHSDASIGELAAGRYDPNDYGAGEHVGDDVDSDHLVPLTAVDSKRRPGPLGLDPMIIRLMILALAVIMAIPLALALRGDGDPTVETDRDGVAPAVDPSADPGAAVEQPAAGAAAAVDGASAPAIADDAAEATANSAAAPSDDEVAAAAPASESDAAPDDAGNASDAGTAEDPAGEAASSAPLTESYDDGDDLVATVDEHAEREPDCALTYTAAGGDSWYRIADGAGITPAELVQQNQATIQTVILPGDEVCLPDGATMPTPPPAVDDADTNPDEESTTDTSSDADESSPTTTAATTTTAPPTTTAPTTTTPTTDVTPASRDEVQAMIQEIWPEELHDKALAVADRESSFIATADNGWCCVGVFQIYWTVHRSWLDDYGITTRDGLKDARKNITAAYALYRRNGGWGPWGG